MCPNCVANLAALGPGYYAAFFVVGLFFLTGGFLYFAGGKHSDMDHVTLKRSILDLEDDDPE